MKQYQRKYAKVNFGINDVILIRLSGFPDAGKSTIANILADTIENAVHVDFDKTPQGYVLDEKRGALNKSKVIIFSHPAAYKYFGGHFNGKNIIDIHVNPSSIEEMYKHSKYIHRYPNLHAYQKWLASFIFNISGKTITINNDFTTNVYKKIDRVIEKIAKRFCVDLTQFIANSEGSQLKAQLRQGGVAPATGCGERAKAF